MSNQTKIKVTVVSGVEGKSVYLDDFRIVGSKPWGGGTIEFEREVDISYLLRVDSVKEIISQEVIRVLEEVPEPTLNDVGLMQPDHYDGAIIINDYWKSAIQTKIKEYK